jgi:hypothetical protein
VFSWPFIRPAGTSASRHSSGGRSTRFLNNPTISRSIIELTSTSFPSPLKSCKLNLPHVAYIAWTDVVNAPKIGACQRPIGNECMKRVPRIFLCSSVAALRSAVRVAGGTCLRWMSPQRSPLAFEDRTDSGWADGGEGLPFSSRAPRWHLNRIHSTSACDYVTATVILFGVHVFRSLPGGFGVPGANGMLSSCYLGTSGSPWGRPRGSGRVLPPPRRGARTDRPAPGATLMRLIWPDGVTGSDEFLGETPGAGLGYVRHQF